MTRKEAERQTRQADALRALGFTQDEAEQLRRISMTLQRWFERECGDSNQYGSWAIERDENGDGPPYLVHHHYRHGNGKDSVTRTRIPDREAGARKRLAAILDARNGRVLLTPSGRPLTEGERSGLLSAYIQSDPRVVALYLIRPGDVPEGCEVGSYYTRGVCVYCREGTMHGNNTRVFRDGETLDCGHVLITPEDTAATGTGGTGYGLSPDGRAHCYLCCHVRDLEVMDARGRVDAYLSSDGRTITNWPGGILAFVTREWETPAGGFCGRTRITRVWARDTHGRMWHGRGPGRGMYLRLHRSRDKRGRGQR